MFESCVVSAEDFSEDFSLVDTLFSGDTFVEPKRRYISSWLVRFDGKSMSSMEQM